MGSAFDFGRLNVERRNGKGILSHSLRFFVCCGFLFGFQCEINQALASERVSRVRVESFRLIDKSKDIYEFQFLGTAQILPGPMILYATTAEEVEELRVAGFKIDYGGIVKHDKTLGIVSSPAIKASLLQVYLEDGPDTIAFDPTLFYTAKLKIGDIDPKMDQILSRGPAGLSSTGGGGAILSLPIPSAPPKEGESPYTYFVEPRLGFEFGNREDETVTGQGARNIVTTTGVSGAFLLGVLKESFFVATLFQYGFLGEGTIKTLGNGQVLSNSDSKGSIQTLDFGVQGGTSFIWRASGQRFHSRVWLGFDIKSNYTVSNGGNRVEMPGLGYRIGLDLVKSVIFGLEFHHRFFLNGRSSGNTLTALVSIPVFFGKNGKNPFIDWMED